MQSGSDEEDEFEKQLKQVIPLARDPRNLVMGYAGYALPLLITREFRQYTQGDKNYSSERDFQNIDKVDELIKKIDNKEKTLSDLFLLIIQLVEQNSVRSISIAFDYLRLHKSKFNVNYVYNKTIYDDSYYIGQPKNVDMTLLINAAHFDSNSAAKLLVARGADITYNSYLYGSAFDQACEHHNMEMAKFYIEHSKKTKVDAQSFLNSACNYASVEALKLVIRHGFGQPIYVMEELNKRFEHTSVKEDSPYKNILSNAVDELKCLKLLFYCCLPFINIIPYSAKHKLHRIRQYLDRTHEPEDTKNADRASQMLNHVFKKIEHTDPSLYQLMKKAKKILKTLDKEAKLSQTVKDFIPKMGDLADRINTILEKHAKISNKESFGEQKTKNPSMFATINIKSELIVLLNKLSTMKDPIEIANLLEVFENKPEVQQYLNKKQTSDFAAALFAAQSLVWSTISITAMYRLIGAPIPGSKKEKAPGETKQKGL